MPSDRATVFGVVRLPEGGGLEGPTLRLEGTVVRQQTRVPPNAEYAPPPDGYALATLAFDTEVRLGTTPVRLGLRVENLLNTTYRDYLSRYRYFADAPGRMVVMQVGVPFGAGS
jgi:iron complex outermembrane receptor protein